MNKLIVYVLRKTTKLGIVYWAGKQMDTKNIKNAVFYGSLETAKKYNRNEYQIVPVTMEWK